MKTKSFTPVGSLHPVLFFVFVYVVALIFAIFICSSLFYSCNASSGGAVSKESAFPEKTVRPGATALVQQK